MILKDPNGIFALQNSLINRTAESPNQYRIFVPLLVNLFISVSKISGPAGAVTGYFFYLLLASLFLFFLMDRFLQIWFSPILRLFGILILAVSITTTFDGNFQPWTILEAGLLTAALLAIYYRRHITLLAILCIATLNRETGIFIALFFLAREINFKQGWRILSRDALLWAAVYLAAWAGIFIGLRVVLGSAPPSDTLPEIIAVNLSPLNLASFPLRAFLFLGPYWLVIAYGWKSAPDFIKRMWLVVPFYLAAVLVFGIWVEIRLLMPLYAIFIPTGLNYLNEFAQMTALKQS